MRLRVEVAGRKGGSGQCWQLLSTGTGMGWGRGEGGLSGEPGKGLGVRTKEDSAKHPPPRAPSLGSLGAAQQLNARGFGFVQILNTAGEKDFLEVLAPASASPFNIQGLGSVPLPGALTGEARMHSGGSQEFQLPNPVIQAPHHHQDPHVLLACLEYLPATTLMTLS